MLRRDAHSRKFKVMAADMLDTSNLGSYLRAFMRRAKGHPRLWGLHNYQDVNYKTSGDTRRMLATVPGEVWLTETGGIVRFAGSRLKKYSPQRAADRTKYMFKLASKYQRKRAGLRSKITRAVRLHVVRRDPRRAVRRRAREPERLAAQGVRDRAQERARTGSAAPTAH